MARKQRIFDISGLKPLHTHEHTDVTGKTIVTHYMVPAGRDDCPVPMFVRRYQSFMEMDGKMHPLLDQYQWSDWKDCEVSR